MCAAWHPTDKHKFCTASRDGTVRIWDSRRGDTHLYDLDMTRPPPTVDDLIDQDVAHGTTLKADDLTWIGKSMSEKDRREMAGDLWKHVVSQNYEGKPSMAIAGLRSEVFNSIKKQKLKLNF